MPFHPHPSREKGLVGSTSVNASQKPVSVSISQSITSASGRSDSINDRTLSRVWSAWRTLLETQVMPMTAVCQASFWSTSATDYVELVPHALADGVDDTALVLEAGGG